ncbi:hypothetical protein GGR57DRAFT_518693 [Xylariaceae sp. FL1272]|nr:hypothetical protein GGR57DRAFT_518693 [Xylariaceae sp. FL1272]
MSSSQTRAAILPRIKSFLDTYELATSASDASILSRDLSPDCHRYIRPSATLKAFGLDPNKAESNETYSARMAGELSLMTVAKANLVEDSIVIDAEAARAACRSEHTLVFKGQTQEIGLEFAWTFDFEVTTGAHGTEAKIKKLVEFIDTAESIKFFQLVSGYVKAQGSDISEFVHN